MDLKKIENIMIKNKKINKIIDLLDYKHDSKS